MSFVFAIGGWTLRIWNWGAELFSLNRRVKALENKTGPRESCDSCGSPMKIARIDDAGKYWELLYFQCESQDCVRHATAKMYQRQKNSQPATG